MLLHGLILQHVGLIFKVSNSNVFDLGIWYVEFLIRLGGSDLFRGLYPPGIDPKAVAMVASLDDAERSAK